MQHGHGLKKLIFDLLNPSPGSGVCRQTFCYHVAAFMIPFNFICNMTVFGNWDFDLWTPTAGSGVMGGLKQNFVIPFNLICNINMF